MNKNEIKNLEKYGRICAVTGHRILKKNFSECKLKEIFVNLIQDGFRVFLSGMAIGFDSVCCKILFELKQLYDIKIVGCIPFSGQEERFNEEQKRIYKEYVDKCDENIVLYEHFLNSAFFERNRLMVDNSEIILAYLYENKGGTHYTVKYALSKQKEVINFAVEEG